MSRHQKLLAMALGATMLTPMPALAQSGEPVVTVEEIIVTAQKRAERLEDVPISITSHSAQRLEDAGVVGLFDLATVTPGVRVDHYGAYTQPTIRGIGTQDVQGPGANANVAIYVNGFYMPSQAGNIFEFANVSQVDVLKGPQGTLFGQNATGGALVITTVDPSHTPGGRISVGYGSFNDRRVSLYGTAGLSENVAVDLSVYYRDSDSYFEDITTGDPTAPISNFAVRSTILATPSDWARVSLTLEYTDIDNPTGLAANSERPIAAFYRDFFSVPMVHTLTPYRTSLDRELEANPVTWAAMLKGEFDLGWADLTSYTQYRDQKTSVSADLDGTTIQYWSVDYEEDETTFTQEFNLSGNDDGPLDWVLGAFYYRNVGALRNNAFQDFFNSGTPTHWLYSDAEVATESTAVFFDGTYQVSDRLWLTAGARYTVEEKALTSQGLLAPFVAFSDSETWNSFTPRLAVRYALDEHSNIYASAAQGFMSGNYQYTTVGPQDPVDPEQITQYEVGYKTARARWSLDLALYATDYEDLQVVVFEPSCACFRVENAPKASTQGAEAQFRALVTDGLSLFGGLAYNRARYDEYLGAGITGAPFLAPNYAYATVPTDLSGNQMMRAPEWTANLGFAYERPVSFGTLNFNGNLYWTDDVPFSPDGVLSQDAYSLLTLQVGWTSRDERYGVTFWGANVADTQYQIFSAAGFIGNNHIWGAPASWGVRLDARF